jgi:hypothetical protein
MPRPEDVNPHNFRVHSVIYNDTEFSIAWGEWTDGTMHLAMRWNGQGDDAGYPKTFGNPVWFLLPENLTTPIIKGILGVESTDNHAVLTTLQAAL